MLSLAGPNGGLAGSGFVTTCMKYYCFFFMRLLLLRYALLQLLDCLCVTDIQSGDFGCELATDFGESYTVSAL